MVGRRYALFNSQDSSLGDAEEEDAMPDAPAASLCCKKQWKTWLKHMVKVRN